MARRIVALIRHAPGAPRGSEPALEANAYAVSQDIDLTVVLLDDAVRLAVASADTPPRTIAETAFPPSAPGHDLRALLESGIDVLVAADGISRHGIDPTDLLPGIALADGTRVAEAIAAAEAVLTW